MAANNLKIEPRKLKILPEDTEFYGFRLNNGTIRPSDHIVDNLGKIKQEELKTVNQVNSWRGLYKTLAKHLPDLSAQMAPFDTATGGKSSKDQFEWTPELVSQFNSAMKNLSRITATYLPKPDEQLILLPDMSTSNLCTGWVLYVKRKSDDGSHQLFPVQFAGAKLPKYMKSWYPCEQECVGVVLAIDQVRHWICESNTTTLVGPDSKPVVEAAQLMKAGKH